MMQQGDRRQATSGSRAGENFWVEETNNFGKKMMESMGWEQGKGLGKKEDGTSSYLRAKFKADQRGIGAKKDQEDATWTATQDIYTDLLKKLKTENNSPSPSPGPIEESVEMTEATITTANSTTTLKNYIAKRTLYGRFKKAKDTGNYGSTAMSEIFGRKPTPVVKEEAQVKKEVKTEAPPEHALLQTSKLSIRDYFANKLAAAGKLGSMSAEEFKQGGLTKAEPVAAVKQESTEEEQPRGFTMDQQEDYYNRMMASAISGAGVQTGQRAKVGLGFGGAGTGGNTGKKAPSALFSAKKSVKLEEDPMHDEQASSPVAAYEEEAQDAAAVDAAPHGTVGHDSEEAKERRRAAKKEAKKRKREEEEKAESPTPTDATTAPIEWPVAVKQEPTEEEEGNEKAAKKAKKRAKKEAATAAEAAAKAEAEEAERKRVKKEKKAAKKKAKKASSDSD